jgi:hypothetical protein
VHRLLGDAAAEGGRLLRVLFIRLGSVPAHPGAAFWADRRTRLLRGIAIMASDTVEISRDWLRNPSTTVLPRPLLGTPNLSSGRPDGRLRKDPLALSTLRHQIDA